MTGIVAVLQVDAQTGTVAQLHNRRRNDGDAETVFKRPHHHTRQLAGNRNGIAAGGGTFVPVFEHGKTHRHVLTVTREAEARNGNDVFNFRNAFCQLRYLRQRRIGTLFGRTRRQLHADHDEALVFGRQERSRQAHKQEYADNRQSNVNNHHAQSFAQDFGDPAFVAVRPVVEFFVKPTEETFFLFVMPFRDCLQHRGTQSRRECQRKEGGEGYRCRHSQCKLLIDIARRPAEHSQRNEYRHQNSSNTDYRTGNLTHCFFGCSLRRQAFTRHNALDVFNHHNRVIDHDTDDQNHCKHGQYVNRHAHIRDEGKTAQQGNRYDDGRNQRITDVLQEEVHHDKNQHHRL